MKKIATIFERDWEGGRKVMDRYVTDNLPDILRSAVATEKLDGTNVRVTVRNGMPVRLEKRRNPDRLQKAKGITEPWYVDASEYESADKWLFDALKNTSLGGISDGEWSGEAVGPNIQGNPLGLENNRIVFFTLSQAPVHENVPVGYAELRVWLPGQQSKYGTGLIEGIVWHCPDGTMYKIKTKDFI